MCWGISFARIIDDHRPRLGGPFTAPAMTVPVRYDYHGHCLQALFRYCSSRSPPVHVVFVCRT